MTVQASELFDPLVAIVQLQVAERMSGQQAGHGFDHVLRVLTSARAIQAEVGGNRLIVELAALLHDVGDAKFHGGVERGVELVKEILADANAEVGVIEHVASIVDNISFRKGNRSQPLTLEGKIVQDADRLDAMGAIGIVRTIEYGAFVGQPFYLESDMGPDSKTGIGHFHAKLFKLRGLMNTEPAQRLAKDREEFMRAFLNQFLEECRDAACQTGPRYTVR